MKARKKLTELICAILVILTLCYALPLNAFAAESTTQDASSQEVNHALIIESESLTVTLGGTIQMTARVTNVDEQPKITWTTRDRDIATADTQGRVKGEKIGETVVYAITEVDGERLQGEFVINVIKRESLLKNLLTERQVLSYQYSYIDDYYYTNDKDAWQYNFGFGKVYDIFAPYLLLEYDYIRIFFAYEGKDWMLQMWKGQYGMIFYGGEIGIYNREHSEKGVNDWTMYNCPAEEDWLKMGFTLYHRNTDGKYEREFTRPYDYYWWCTGFKNGHLRQQEPANELRMVGRITLKSEEMATIVYDGLIDCGFKIADTNEVLATDSVFIDGDDLYFNWQNINDAESTMAIKIGVGAVSTAILLPFFFPIMIPAAGIFGILVLIASLLV